MDQEEKIENIWSDFTQNTGCHGMNKISSLSKAGNKLRFFLWLFIILASATFLVYLIVNQFQHYYEYPTIHSMYHQPVPKLDFPAVTICNLQSLNRSAMKNDSRITNFYLGKSPAAIPPHQINWSDPFYEQEGFFRDRTLEDILSENKKILNSFVYSAQFDLHPIDINEHFNVVMSNSGPCFTTNLSKILETTYTGAWFNLNVLLYLDHANDYYGSWLGEGVQFMVHDPMEAPSFTGDGGNFARPGQEVFAHLYKTHYEYLSKPFEAIPNTYCKELNDDGTLYVESVCFKDCLTQYMNDTCGCIHYTHHDNLYYCSKYSELTCVKTANANFLKNLHERCNCPMACQSTHYQVSLTSSLYPAEFYSEFICGNDMVDCRQNYISLHIYYDKLSTTFVTQVPKFSTAGDILANLGGEMGLFLGASIVTLTELVEFVFLLMVCFYRRVSTKNTTKVQEIHIPREDPIHQQDKKFKLLSDGDRKQLPEVGLDWNQTAYPPCSHIRSFKITRDPQLRRYEPEI